MKDQKNKGTLGILSLVLWAALLTVIARLLTRRAGWDWDLNGILFKILLWVMLCIAIFFCWWIFTGLRLNRFMKRIEEAGYTYLKTHDVDVYLQPAKDLSSIKMQNRENKGEKEKGIEDQAYQK